MLQSAVRKLSNSLRPRTIVSVLQSIGGSLTPRELGRSVLRALGRADSATNNNTVTTFAPLASPELYMLVFDAVHEPQCARSLEQINTFVAQFAVAPLDDDCFDEARIEDALSGGAFRSVVSLACVALAGESVVKSALGVAPTSTLAPPATTTATPTNNATNDVLHECIESFVCDALFDK